MQYNIDKIKQRLRRKLDADRYEHTIGVTYTATALAMRHNCDLKKAELEGLLHDCAKCMSDDAKLSKCVKYHLSVTETERRNPYLLHSKLGAFLAMNKYHVDDKDILNAVLYHTTGRPAMSVLEKIVFIADYIEPGRSKATRLSEIRHIAFIDLDLTMYMILSDTMEYLKKKSGEIDTTTEKALTYYTTLIKEKEDLLKKESNV